MKKQLRLALSALLLMSSVSLHCAKNNPPAPAPQAPVVEAPAASTGVVDTCKNAVVSAYNYGKQNVYVIGGVTAAAVGVYAAWKIFPEFRAFFGVEDKKEQARFTY